MKYIFTIAAIVGMLPVHAQQDTAKSTIFITSKYVPGEGMYLKFIPGNASDMYRGLLSGFIIERANWRAEGQRNTFQKITPAPVLPFSEKEYAPLENGVRYYKAQQDLLQAAAEAVHQAGNPLEQIRLHRDMRQWAAIYVLQSIRERQASIGSGLEYIDRTAEAGKAYTYRIRLAGDETVFSTHNTVAKKLEIAVLNVEGKGGDHLAQLRWIHQPQEWPWLAYHIEKSTDGISFFPLTETPLFYNKRIYETDTTLDARYMYFADSLARNYQPYFYRLKAKDYFGEWSEATIAVKVSGEDATPPALPFGVKTTTDEDRRTIEIKWSKELLEPDFAGFRIFKIADSPDGVTALHKGILPPDQRSFKIENIAPDDRIEFFITVEDTHGNLAATLPKTVALDDVFAPDAPTALTAQLVDNQRVVLSWTPSSATDWWGYNILVSLRAEGPYSRINTHLVKENQYTDTLNNEYLEGAVYYQVVALDKHLNQSPPSHYASVTVEDNLPPLPPKLLPVNVTGQTVEISWLPGIEKTLKRYEIFIKYKPAGKWQLLYRTPDAAAHSYIWQADTAVWAGLQMVAIDAFDQRSAPSNTKIFKVKASTAPPAITGLSASPIAQEAIQLQWVPPKISVAKYLIFRAEDDAAAQLVGYSRNGKFTDDAVQPGVIYQYYVLVRDTKGRLSGKGSVASVQF